MKLFLLCQKKMSGSRSLLVDEIHLYPNLISTLGKERVVKEEKIDFSKKEDEKWKRRSLPAGKVQGTLILRN